MPFEPNLITKQHILNAIDKIEKECIKLLPSTKWLVEVNGKSYPPKEIMRYAHEQMNGEYSWNYSGGEPTNKYLEKFGFKISSINSDPVQLLIDNYKINLRRDGLKNELYKWQLLAQFNGKPDILAADFNKEIEGIYFGNLIYGIGIGVIRHIARDRPEEYRQCFKDLYNEDVLLNNRIELFTNETLKLYRQLEKNEKLAHHHDERTIATLLTYHNPNKYTFYKDSFYQKYCKLISEIPKKKGEKYSHYLELIDSLIDDYISQDDELLELFNANLTTNCYKDKAHRILAQDILYSQLDKADVEDEINATDFNNKPESDNLTKTNMEPLNQILFGPPGTGKTFNTINIALKIIGETTVGLSREKIKEIFDVKVKEGQIVFCTFHQSMSYEDFIEGIKPLKPNLTDTHVRYDVVDGIFKKLCIEAKAKNKFNIKLNGELLPLTKDLFEEFYDSFSETLPKHENIDSPIKLKTKEDSLFELFRNTVGSIVVRAGQKKTNSTVSFNELSQIIFNKKVPTYKSYAQPILDKIFEGKEFSVSEIDNSSKNYVLIIDEINRGNVSQIFGELITLIEKDKRLGKTEALEVILPYSKEKFGVPSNLFIIGTMNTADRSVEALDAALRRRFSFTEMQPKPELVSPQRKIWELWWSYPELTWDQEPYASYERKLYNLFGIKNDFDPKASVWDKMKSEGKNENQISYFNDVQINGINLELVLRTINKRVEKLLDKDHQIGHSYFMPVNSIDDLQLAFKNEIIPLLQEYFFGDYSKIGLVLGKGFVRVKEWDKKENSFADFDTESAGDFDERDVYEIIDYSKPDLVYTIEINKMSVIMNFEKAIKLLIKQTIE